MKSPLWSFPPFTYAYVLSTDGDVSFMQINRENLGSMWRLIFVLEKKNVVSKVYRKVQQWFLPHVYAPGNCWYGTDQRYTVPWSCRSSVRLVDLQVPPWDWQSWLGIQVSTHFSSKNILSMYSSHCSWRHSNLLISKKGEKCGVNQLVRT